MAEELNTTNEGRRIAREYLSKRGWAREWRRTLNRELYPAFQREELEAKERQCDQLEEDAETFISQEVERWRHDSSPQAKEVLQGIYEILANRNDLGFFAKQIVGHLHRQLFAGG